MFKQKYMKKRMFKEILKKTRNFYPHIGQYVFNSNLKC